MNALGIVNLALRRLNEKIAVSLDVDSTAVRACLQFFAPAMDEVTSESEWSFAKTRAALSLDTTSENQTKYEYMYDRPADALRIIPESSYEIEGTKIYSDVADLAVPYIRSLVDETGNTPEVAAGVYLPVKFYLAVSLRLATHVALALNKSDYLGALQSEYSVLLTQAKNVDAMENPGAGDDVEHWHEVT